MSEIKKIEFIDWLEKEIDSLIRESSHFKSEVENKKLTQCLAKIETYLRVLKYFRVLTYAEC